MICNPIRWHCLLISFFRFEAYLKKEQNLFKTKAATHQIFSPVSDEHV